MASGTCLCPRPIVATCLPCMSKCAHHIGPLNMCSCMWPHCWIITHCLLYLLFCPKGGSSKLLCWCIPCCESVQSGNGWSDCDWSIKHSSSVSSSMCANRATGLTFSLNLCHHLSVCPIVRFIRNNGLLICVPVPVRPCDVILSFFDGFDKHSMAP